ncbi:MAG TPA: hypothetical protein VM285_17490, partial [Polyangia bacterium]|nr:hypothetical protein [Polyangia bacterium]
MIRFAWPILATGFAIAIATGATAQSPQEWREDGGTQEAFALEQSYHGTRPGQGNRLPRVEELRNKPGGWVT